MESSPLIIEVVAQYLPAHSAPEAKHFQFAYTITLTNTGDQPVQLLERYWLITDGNQKETEVSGEGVVGEQPHLAVGESYQYTSGAMLETPVGTMQGHYLMQRADGSQFTAPIAVFRLALESALH